MKPRHRINTSFRARSVSEGRPLPSLTLRARKLIVLLALLSCGTAGAREVTTNGLGGGPWSDPATWRGKAVPRAEDDVVIQKGDAVVFDRNDEGKISCQKLFIDPKGALSFKTGAGKQVCCVGDVIESYGTIKLDATRFTTDSLELRLVGDTAARRAVKLLRGAALLIYGRKNLARDRRNVALTAPPVGEKKEIVPGVVEAGRSSMLDLQWARVDDLQVKANQIDNTGAQANERLNVIACQFTGQGRLLFSECDTPVITGNSFRHTGTPVIAAGAIHVVSSPLAEIRGNTVAGGFQYGIAAAHGSDTVVTGNSVEKCTAGLHFSYGQNNMAKQNTIRACETGIDLRYTSAVLEECSVDGAKTGLYNLNSNAQFTSCQVNNLTKGGLAIVYESGGAVTLLNCNVGAGQVKIAVLPAKPAAGPTPTPVTALNYLIVAVKGAPADAQVEVRTVKPVPVTQGAPDPNVRNAPASLTNGTTPLPQTLKPLIVTSWVIDSGGKTVPAPEYAVQVLAPAVKAGVQRAVLKAVNVKPLDSWFRVKPNDATPTLEVSLK
jgi:hypothetical protein